ncbi:MAG: 4'-phosphopantetheinyl transferase family protein [Anaerotignum sp.]
MAEILYINVGILKEEALFAQGMSLISAERKEKILQFQNPSTVRLSLGAGVLLRIALEKCGLSDKIEQIQTGPYGKPYLQQEDFHFSLSHSGDYAICAFSHVQIGADLQQIKEKIPLRTRKILSSTEKAYLEKLPDTERIQAFYRLWAMKESLIKWDGRGLRLPLEKLSFVADDILQDRIFFEDKVLHFKEYHHLLPGYTICLCSEDGIFPEHITEITAESLK